MKQLVLLFAVLGGLMLLTACGASEPMSPEEKERQQRIEQCARKAKRGCDATAKEACKGKSSFQKIACEEASRESCMAAARKACE